MAEVEPELAVFECDESYFGGVRKGKRGRGATGKVCVFGILKRGGRVYALPVANATSVTLLTALKTRVLADSCRKAVLLRREQIALEPSRAQSASGRTVVRGF